MVNVVEMIAKLAPTGISMSFLNLLLILVFEKDWKKKPLQ
jgi:hypothetical protein